MLAIFGLTAFTINAAERVKLWFRDEVRPYYNIHFVQKSDAYTFLVFFDNVVYILMCIPAIYVIEKFGMRLALGIGVLLSLIGSWMALMPDQKLIGLKIFG